MKPKLLLLFFFITLAVTAQEKYTVTFNELALKMAEKPRPVIIKMYTDWCSACKIQDKQLAKDKELQKILSADFYYMELNAEAREDILFNNRNYHFIANGKSGGVHELVLALLGKQPAYPGWVFLSPGYETIDVYRGLLKSPDLKNICRNITAR